ncbi:hypothetical protein [Bradyrhizobium canariense]|uniref:Uncharacterized protein n=1 Tax=Bradyrhizobium canariense TaxID=255045 RepID=A0A1X3GU54_9BRAD|nr:hypothetical protein [Bradyrhizobium canariense]OSI80349.1 hypothetical protein BSZ22_01015 [Bradyrhizobium canariense]OSI82510.1 hypothetical protein BSZ23_01220 [Bradyrhizobium canariense]OSI96968.1 hypothetical protein BSZ25_01010 [Bradyrhizobium canariense]OSI99287.1 hypothetical protein BSZ24_00635 [Bradyrhizobium canariense]OSJ16625.1 hypothetical protein BSZ16_00965 [Bradyrhizobium canariense]
MLLEAGEHLEKIGHVYGQLQEKFWEVGPACAEAFDKLPKELRKEFISRLPFSRSNYSKWIAIGKAVDDLDERMREIIPPKLSVAYEFVLLEKPERTRLLEERPIKAPPLRRADIIRWKRKNRGEPVANEASPSGKKRKASAQADPAVPGRFYSALKPKRSLTSSETEALDKQLQEIARTFDMEVAFPPIVPAKDTTAKVVAHMRRQVNKLIRGTLKVRAEQNPGRKKSILALASELRIWPEDDEERMRDSLDEVGLAHEFDRIRSEAHELYPMEGPGYPAWLDAVDRISPPREMLEEEAEELRRQLARRPGALSGLNPDDIRTRTADFR